MEQCTMFDLGRLIEEVREEKPEPVTHWLDQSGVLRLFTGCGKEIHAYVAASYEAEDVSGQFLHIAPFNEPTCSTCRVARVRALQLMTG
jgi:hypothetical protein